MFIKKIQGYVNDHKATLEEANESKLVIKVNTGAHCRNGERPTVMLLNIEFRSIKVMGMLCDQSQAYMARTLFDVEVRPVRARDRRSDSVYGQAIQLLSSFKSYLVAQDVDEKTKDRIIEPRD